MDPSRILVALEEREKWRERRIRLQQRLKSIQARRRYLQEELAVVRRRIAQLVDTMRPRHDPVVIDSHSRPFFNTR